MMGYNDEIVTNGPCVHDSDETAINTFGRIGSVKSIKSMKRIPSRIPISVPDPYLYERERDMEYPTKDRDRVPFGQEVGVSCLKNIKRFTNLLMCSYSCNEELCPVIKDRLEQHQSECRSAPHSSLGCRDSDHQHHRPVDSQTATSLTPSKHRASTKVGINLFDSHSIQTNITNTNEMSTSFTNRNIPIAFMESNSFYDYNNNEKDGIRLDDYSCGNRKPYGDETKVKHYHNSITSDDFGISLKRTKTQSVISANINIYKDYVLKEVRRWFKEIPIFADLEKSSNFDKNKIIADLTQKIVDLLKETNNEAYDTSILFEIENSLNGAIVTVWNPRANLNKKILYNNLLNRIKGLNKIFFNNNNYGNKNRESGRKPTECNRCLHSSSEKAEEEISIWLSMIKFKKLFGMSVDKNLIIKTVLKKVRTQLMKTTNPCNDKLLLRKSITEVLNDLPREARCTIKRTIIINKLAEDLANKLIQIKTNYINKTPRTMYQTGNILVYNKKGFENVIQKEISKCFAKLRFVHQEDVEFQISNIFINYVDSFEEFDVKQQIFDVLKCAFKVPEFLASNIAQNILIGVKSALNEYNKSGISNIIPTTPKNILVYTSQEECIPIQYPVTSTPKKKKTDSISKLNPEEIEYSEKVGHLISAWMVTLPEQFNAPDEKTYKETMIKDLAGEITDAAKLEQLATIDEKEKWLKFIVYKWLQKLDVFDLHEVKPQIEEFLIKIKDIPVPVLTRPQHGNRQAMANIQHMESELGWVEYFVPKGKDILEDEISIWMNEQPSNIFDTDKNTRNNKIQELAAVLQNKLTNKRSENEISNDVVQWLYKVLKPDQTANAGEFAANLKARVIKLPQDATLATNHDKKVQQKAEHLEAKKNNLTHHVQIKTTDKDTINLDNTMQKYIAKFIEHNYDIEDPIARSAFSHLLKTKLLKLNPPTRKEVYDNFIKSESQDKRSHQKLIKELNYIKDISDWLKNIPVESRYNTVGNRERVDFVTDLARNIFEVEEQREDNPQGMDYNLYMASLISDYLIQLPILEEYKNDKNMMFMIDQLIGKVIVHRNEKRQTSDSIDTVCVHCENIGDFIEEFICVNGSEIADDEIKLEAWTIRILNEIKKMVRENADPTALSKIQVYSRLTNLPLSEDESIKQFDTELVYIKEISEWLRNLPLLPIDQRNEEERVKMICELAEKITKREKTENREINNLKNPNDTKRDAEFTNYVCKWITDLSLDKSHDVVKEVVLQQLINRIERVKTRQENHDLSVTKSTENMKSKISEKEISKTMKTSESKQVKNPAGNIVDTIEKWSASLPIKSDNEKTIKSMKDDVSKKLFQKVGELSIDPRTVNDDLLYQDILTDEVDALIEKLPQNQDLQKNKDKLKSNLIRNIVEAHKALKENCAGEFYKQKLKHAIEASIPHPVKARQAYDPGFEIYKSRLADMFILENFDHANDAVKIKYERKVRDEIDKFYDSVKNKNVISLTKDEIYNELYSALFKVQIPNQSSVIGEVEEIKTRCEIDAWFEQLPLQETNGLTELFEIDKILATLAKRIHEIEKKESKPSNKIHKEIMKWIVKLPLLPGEESNADKFAKILQELLKSTFDKRKCLISEQKSKKGKKKLKSKENSKINIKDGQVPGPSTEGKMWVSQVEHAQPKKKAADIIIEIVEGWCHQLPIKANTPQEEEKAKIMKDNLSTKIIIKISELNMYPDTFGDDFTYNDLIDEELDLLLAVLPTCCDFEKSKEVRKMQLKEAIKSVKPLFREEKARHQYKQNLNTTVAKVLRIPKETTDEKEALFNNLKDEIVENFIQFNYDKEDDESRRAYKAKVHDGVVKFLTNVVENKHGTSIDPLIKQNKLLCELAKIPVPSDDSIKEEVEEIRMKNEIAEFFDELSFSGIDKDKKKQINRVKSNLAKKLNDIELNGYSVENNIENKMKQEIAKSLKKINKEIKPEVVRKFVNKLKDNEIVRRAPRKVKNDATCDCKMAGCGEHAPAVLKPKHEHQTQSSSNEHTSTNYVTVPYVPADVSGSKMCAEQYSRTECPQKEEYSNNERAEYKGVRCICGGIRMFRGMCYKPRWCCNEDIVPMCWVPPGYFYYR